jgi:ABC-type transporter Mla subunit MlaD
MKTKTLILACALALGAAIVQPNPAVAQAASPSPQVQLADSVAMIRTETVATRDQLQSAVDALNALTKQEKGDLQPTYNAYVEQVKKTHDVAETTATRFASMQTASKQYFDVWQQQISGINSESLRRQAQKRMDSVVKNYNDVIASLSDATEKFKPFLSNLDDVQKMLAIDITPGGVKAIRGTVSDANWSMKKVRSSLSSAIDDLSDMAQSLSSQTGN